MSFLYRPTPVVNLGNGRFSSRNVLNRLPGSVMQGIPAGASNLGAASPTGVTSRMRRVNTRMQPWIKSSGTMGSFIPNGLGQDDGSGIDWSSAGDISPTIPSYTPPDLVPPDLGSPSFSPNVPASIPISSAPAPPFALPSPGTLQTSNAPVSSTLTPPPTANFPQIPGTQPTQPSAATQAASASGGIVNAIKSFFGSSSPTVPPGYKALPGYTGAPVTSPPSFFSQSTILPQVGSNGLVLGLGLAALLVLGGGGFAAGRSGK